MRRLVPCAAVGTRAGVQRCAALLEFHASMCSGSHAATHPHCGGVVARARSSVAGRGCVAPRTTCTAHRGARSWSQAGSVSPVTTSTRGRAACCQCSAPSNAARGGCTRTRALCTAASPLAGEPTLPHHARVVIVGGGVIGSSVAYHLVRMGLDGVVLLERDQLTSGTTWHAAGLIQTFGSTSDTSTAFRTYSKQLYASLEAETGQATGFKPVGCITLATNRDHLEEYRRAAAYNRRLGVAVEELSPAQVRDLFPLAHTEDVLAGFMVADDGRVNPVDVTVALAKGARMCGAAVYEGVRVAGVTTEDGRGGDGRSGRRVTGVTTAGGQTVLADAVVNCAGMWARQLGELAGVAVPNQAAEHYYLITEPMDGVSPDWPVIEDPSALTYVRPEAGGLMVGLFEPEAAAWCVDSVPHDFSFGEIQPDWERMAPYLERAMARVPATLDVGARSLFCGPESFTPDRMPIVGEAPELANFFVGAGLNSIGILTGGGVGRLLAHWIVHGSPDMDVTGINIDRFHPFQANPAYRAARVVESLGMVYAHTPHRPMRTARGAKRSPLHDRLAARGAYFQDACGWEAPAWFAPPGVDPAAAAEPLSWGRHPWFEYWRAEHLAARGSAVVFDMSFMVKALVQGRDAGVLLNRLSTADVDGPVGRVTYTQWLNESAGVEADVTVTKLGRHRFMVVASDTAHRHVLAWMERHTPAGGRVAVTDVTGAYALLNLQGPRSRELLQQVTSADLSNGAFRFRHVRDIDIGYARVTCSRLSYVGELGFELLIPAEHAAHVYARITAAASSDTAGAAAASGAPGLVHAGLQAVNSLRLEKAFRDYGHDVDNTDGLEEVGLDFTCCLRKPGPFIGRDAVEMALAKLGGRAPRKRLVQVLLQDPEPLMYHAEVVLRDGVVVGDVRSASYGHTLGGAVGLAMIDSGPRVDAAYVRSGTWEVDVAGVRYAATVSLKPLYDPTHARMRG